MTTAPLISLTVNESAWNQPKSRMSVAGLKSRWVFVPHDQLIWVVWPAGGDVESSLVIVPAPLPSAKVAPTEFVSTTVKPSLASTTASPIAATWIVFWVSPAAKVSVPDWAT